MSRLQNASPAQQLDFYQAMEDFTQMFPHMDCEVIEAVLRANNGAVDSTIDQLLTMNTEGEIPRGDITGGPVAVEETMEAAAPSPDYVNTQDFALLEGVSDDEERDVVPELPPKQRKISSGRGPVSHHSPHTQPLHQDIEIDSPDLMDASISEIMNLPPAPPPPNISPQKEKLKAKQSWETPAQPIPRFRHGAPSAPVAKNPAASVEKLPGVRSRSKSMPTTSYRHLEPVCLYSKDRKWNPPLLGDLPDDFLRLDLGTSKSSDSQHSRPSYRGERHRRHRSQGDKVPHHSHDTMHSNHSHTGDVFGTPQPKHSSTVVRPSKKTNSHSHGFATHKSHQHKSQTKSAHHHHQHPQGFHTFNPHVHPQGHSSGSPQKQHGDIILSQSGDWLTARLVENERRRGEVDEGDTEMAQYLQDEYLALVLQNSEFLEELTRDADFMQTLTRGNKKSSPSPNSTDKPEVSSSSSERQYMQEPQLSSDIIPQSQIEGYGEDRQNELSAFPHDTNWGVVTSDPPPSDKHSELKKQIEQMGTSSRRKLADVARRFFTRKKKQPNKPLYKNLHTPSTMNLLLEEEVPEQHIPQQSPT